MAPPHLPQVSEVPEDFNSSDIEESDHEQGNLYAKRGSNKIALIFEYDIRIERRARKPTE
jgi:hypothetical protein